MNTPTPSRPESVSDLVQLHDGKAITDSLKIATVFGKQHWHVMRDIKTLDCSKKFSRSNFGCAEYKDNQGKPRPMYEITRDGFMFLAMGFTGAKAAQWKERYIEAFNKMEAQLHQPQLQVTQQPTRHELPFSTQELHSHMAHIRDRLMDVGNALNEAFGVEQLITEKMELNMLAALSIEKSAQREVETKTPDRRVFQQLEDQINAMKRVLYREMGMGELVPREPEPSKRQQPRALPKPEPRKLSAPATERNGVPFPFRASPKLYDWFKVWLGVNGYTRASFCKEHNIPVASLVVALKGSSHTPKMHYLKKKIKKIVQEAARNA